MPESIPFLERADGTPIKDDFKRYHFNIAIESVIYESPPDYNGTLRCAVLLNINFDVKGDVLAYALLPLTTGPQEQSSHNDKHDIFISEHLPHKTEWAQTGRHVGSKSTSATPNVSLGASGYSMSVAGMGVNKQRDIDEPIMISLRPIMKAYRGSPVQLDWEFENKEGPYYPSDLKILVIVEKQIEFRGQAHFPFILKLNKDLEIKSRGRTTRYDFSRLIPRRHHDGWVFQINGNYRPYHAKAALRDAARPHQKMKIVGLHAAIDDWYMAQQIAGKVPRV